MFNMYRFDNRFRYIAFFMLLLFSVMRELVGENYSLMLILACIIFLPFVLYNLLNRFSLRMDFANTRQDKALERQVALKQAEMFIAPYKSIWKNIKLANNHCYLYLGKDGVTITGSEKEFPYRKFQIVSSKVHDYYDLWNMICRNFNHCKIYDDLLDDCRLYQVQIYEYVSKPNIKQESTKQIPETVKVAQKIDINNCSEIELTELPGVSIVMAKKVVKKRLEIGGFKTIDDFFLFLKLKPHMQKQLRDRICINKMKSGFKKIEHNTERSVDL